MADAVIFDFNAQGDGRAVEKALSMLDVTRNSGGKQEAAAFLQAAYQQVLIGDGMGALANAEAAADLCKSLRDRAGEASAKNLIGRAFVANQEPEEGKRPLKEALKAAEDLGNKKLEAMVLETQGQMFGGIDGGLSNAVAAVEAAQGIYQSLGEKKKEVGAVLGAMALFQGAGDLFRAAERAEDALAITQAWGRDKKMQGDVLATLAELRLALGATQDAQYTAKDAQEIFSSMGDAHSEARVLRTWMNAQLAENKPGEALETCAEVVDLFRSAGDKEQEAAWLVQMATLQLDAGQATEAAGVAFQGAQLYGSIGKTREAMAAGELAKKAKTEELGSILRGALAVTAHERHQQDIVVAPAMQGEIAKQMMALVGR